MSDEYGALPDPDKMYPVVRLLVRYGNAMAIGVGAVIAIAGVWAAAAGFG